MSDGRLYAFFCNVVHVMKDIVYRGMCKKGFLLSFCHDGQLLIMTGFDRVLQVFIRR